MAMQDHDRPGEETRWLERRGNIDRLVWLLYAACAALFLADIIAPKHGAFAVEHTFGFYAWFGFLACGGVIVAARLVRRLLMRPEDYYDR